jgi:hypothetical protein
MRRGLLPNYLLGERRRNPMSTGRDATHTVAQAFLILHPGRSDQVR